MAKKNNQLAEKRFDLDVPSMTLDVVKSEEFSAAYSALVATVKQAQDLKKEIDTKLKSLIEEKYLEDGTCKVETGDVNITYVPSTFRQTFDAEAFSKEHPTLYKKYLKTSPVSASIRAQLKKK